MVNFSQFFVDYVWKEKYLDPSDQSFWLKLVALQKVNHDKNEFVGFSPLKCIEHVVNNYESIKLRIENAGTCGKFDKNSIYFRELGNAEYRNLRYDQSLRAYNLAICFAPSSCGYELALAYSNRAALFIQINEPKLALKDVELALAQRHPEELLEKLLTRKKKCEEMIKQYNSAIDIERTKFTKDLFTLKSPSDTITHAEDFVKIESNSERGRHLIVTKDVSPGTVVVVDDPFAKVLIYEHYWEFEHCHFCHKRIKQWIPCTKCVYACFCDETCRNSANESFHLYECEIGKYLNFMRVHRANLIALRIVTSIGPKKLYQYFKEGQTFLLGPKYDSLSYETIYNLISHPDKLKREEILQYSTFGTEITTVMENETPFFVDIPKVDEKGFKNYISSLILQHLFNLPPNAHSLFEATFRRNGPLKQSEIRSGSNKEYGAGAFAVLSLINHACDPNVTRFNLSNGKTAVVALRYLRAGEEILDNYGAHYAVNPFYERMEHLATNYYFKCSCVACKNMFPLLPFNPPEVFICSACSKKSVESVRFQSKFITKVKLDKTNETCRICSEKYSFVGLNKNLNMAIDKQISAFTSVLQNQPLEAMDKLTSAMEFFNLNLVIPYLKINESEETFKQAINLIIHFSQYA